MSRLSDTSTVVIVGAGHGGSQMATQLRQDGFGGSIVLIGDERYAPYHRPPLSKSLLSQKEAQLIRPIATYAQQSIELHLQTRVDAIDARSSSVALVSGRTIHYDALVLATGATPRIPPISGIDHAAVHSLRNFDDAQRLSAQLTTGARLVVIGGGWIGLEVAAAAAQAGVQVTVLEREARILARVASPVFSAAVAQRHARVGTQILTSVGVQSIGQQSPSGPVGVQLVDGQFLPADAIVVGAGAVPNSELAERAGLACEQGILVCHKSKTSDDKIFAIGDATRRPLAGRDGLFRLESIPSSAEQARQVSAELLGLEAPASEVPWFWSDQFDYKIQIAGLIEGALQSRVLRGPTEHSFAVFHASDTHLIAVESINFPEAFALAKELIASGQSVLLEELETLMQAKRANRHAVPSVSRDATESAIPNSGEPLQNTDAQAAPKTTAATLEPLEAGQSPRVIFIDAQDEVRIAPIEPGVSIMEAAMRNGVPGVVAECGGSCSCGTCQVYVDANWLAKLEAPGIDELGLLEFAPNLASNSRLACQILMSAELDGIVVRTPAV